MNNWQDIIKNNELVYASVSEDTGFRTWSLKKTTCNISFYEEYQIEDIDKIVCNILNSHNNNLEEERLVTILGFNVIDNFDVTPKRYADNAELDVFRVLIQTVIDWGLIIKEDDNYSLTELGQKALTEERKYKFYSGSKELFENPNFKPLDAADNLFFPYNTALGVFSEITNKRNIEYNKIKLEEVFSAEEADLIKRIKLQSEVTNYIYFSEQTKYFRFDSCQVDIRLYKQNDEYYPIVFYNDKISTQATDMLHKPENVGHKDKKIEWGLYLKLIKDPNAQLDYQTIFPFEDLLELSSLIEDKRLVWGDNSLFTFIAENSNADQWFAISNNCPVDIIKLHLIEYREKLDWTSLSLRIDDNFLIQNATSYPWNFEAISAKEDISIEVIKTLLLIPELEEQEWDWDAIMPQLDLEFIKSNIDKVNFELAELTKTNILDVQPLISQYPTKKWDWTFISKEYDLSYILKNINSFNKYLNLISTINRAFTSKSDVQSFCQSADLLEVLTEAKENKLSHFSPNQSDYVWSETLIDLLENTGYLTWESGNYALGFECNPYIKWTYDLFTKYRSKITTQKGVDFVSSHISNIQIVSDFIEFNWNWDLISTNVNLINNSSFILELKDRLDINLLLSEIEGETLEIIFEKASILAFLEEYPNRWTDITEKPSKEFILQNIDFNWDWKILTKRFCSTIKIESLGNDKWVDKWDWEYLTQNLDFAVVTEELDLYVDRWDWHYISQEADKQFILENLPEYNDYWNWELLLSERIDKEDLELQKLTEIATCISVLDYDLTSKLWGIITRKFDYDTLEELIIYNREIFHWDYGYFYDLPDFSPLNYLNENDDFIDWSAFSSSKSLNKSLKWDKNLFGYGVWIDKILKLLKTSNYKWDFKSLSKLDSVNWNSSILKIKTANWNWEYLSEHSRCFKKDKGFTERFNEFVKFIDFQVFSKRIDSGITEELIGRTIDKNWDWEILSVNQSIKFTIAFINEHNKKGWNWEYLSARRDIEFNNEVILELCDKNWDWQEISKRTDIVFSEEIVSNLHNKPLDWFLVSQNETFTPNSKVLSLLHSKELDWISISSNQNLSIEILWDYKELLDWQRVTRNNVVELSDKSFLSKYQDYLDWNYVSHSADFSISSENLERFKNKLNWLVICERKDFVISENLLQPFADFLSWSKVSMSMNIHFTNELIERYRDKWDWQLLRKNPQIIDRLDSTLSKYQAEFNCVDFLEQFERKPFIYHFTHSFNAIDIIKERKILSRNKTDGKFANAAGNLVERRGTAHDYARFYFRPQTPTQFYNECLGHDSESGYLKEWTYDGEHFSKWKTYYPQARNLGLPKCPIPVFFKFDLKEVLMKMPSKCFYSTGNMQTNWSQVKKVSNEPNSLNVFHLYSDVNDYENYKQYSQQEFLIEEEFDFSKLNSFEIICYNSVYADILKSQLGNDPICKKINVDDWEVYHRGNRELRISEKDSEISIESEYRDSAYFSIKGKGLKEIEILETENIQKETETEIIAYPKIKFVKTENPIDVYFVDLAIGVKDWLVYSNQPVSNNYKRTSMNEYIVPEEVLSLYRNLDNQLELKLSKDLFYPHMLNSHHGIAHTARVLFGTCLLLFFENDLLCEVKDAILYAAIIHDLGKTNNREGSVHGENSAHLYRDKIQRFITDINLQKEVLNAVKFHSIDDESCPQQVKNSRIWKILKDADALDRGRFNSKCDISYLRLEIFKTELGIPIVQFMEKLPFHTQNLQWDNPFIELANCITQINK